MLRIVVDARNSVFGDAKINEMSIALVMKPFALCVAVVSASSVKIRPFLGAKTFGVVGHVLHAYAE